MSSIGPTEEIDEVKERAHFQAVVNAFKYYKLCSLERIHKSEKIISMLPPSDQRRLDRYRTYLTKFKRCLDVNNDVVHLIIKDVDTMFENVEHSTNGSHGTENFGCNYNNCEITSLKQHKMQHDVEKRVIRTMNRIVCGFSDMPNEISIEPPYDILLDIIQDVGFEILKEQTSVRTRYAQNPNSMMQHEYNSVFFVCRKAT
ncbi:hypothetical protein KGM_209093 [Danaus plexippus plexippus]|uniref:Uncharacterized protein n=1 Tax=Danaus plexippus plexippus TaxID=278856 RepID=A0A212EPL6_DANPL|nr:hypothetical protein KGM_209093 [Danaus plexippus plexippus]